MLDIEFIRAHPEEVKRGIAKKQKNQKLVDEFLTLDEKWRKLTHETDELRKKQKTLGEERKIEEAKQVKEKLQALETELEEIEHSRNKVLRKMPNLPLDSVPEGKSDKDNVVRREVGEKPRFAFQPKEYLALAEALDIIDVERAAKVSGSRFGYLKGAGALLEFALLQYAMERLSENGFVPIIPPVIVKEEMMRGMGYVDSEEDREERYFLEKDKQYLVGTSEQSIGPMHADEIFEEASLPKRYAGFSTCFRREAGSYGKDTKGILRVHQFDKIEMFIFSKPEESAKEHEYLLEIEEGLMQGLRLPYRVVALSTGDLSQPSAATFDIEAWLPGQNGGKGEYRETHSTSNTTDYQARRLNIKYRPVTSSPKPEAKFVHMLNGTGFAIGRMIIAILENYQREDGSIGIPEALHPYMFGKKIIEKK